MSVPDTNNRYYLMPMLEAWTNVFASPGSRTTGTKAQSFLITGPMWTGKVPTDTAERKSPTDMVWIIGRFQAHSEEDCTAVQELQHGLKLTPLSAWGSDYTPPPAPPIDESVDIETPPPEQVAQMTPDTFFAKLAQLMVDNPPVAEDGGALKHLKAIGVEPGNYNPDSSYAEEVETGVESARRTLNAATKKPGDAVDGWSMAIDGIGDYGTDYTLRRRSADRTRRKQTGGCRLSELLERPRRRQIPRFSQIRPALRQGPASAGQLRVGRLLVGDHV